MGVRLQRGKRDCGDDREKYFGAEPDDEREIKKSAEKSLQDQPLAASFQSLAFCVAPILLLRPRGSRVLWLSEVETQVSSAVADETWAHAELDTCEMLEAMSCVSMRASTRSQERILPGRIPRA